ncbi:hypothetical protein [Crocosphaera sp. Alani8]|uniref:hypothetical protein n=1 Tax=Crocosphaera sp. Alani8 TaxID=3038952 RepID=UPI00313E979C
MSTSIKTEAYIYDEQRNLVYYLEEQDNDGDNIVDDRQTETSTYDGQGNLVYYLIEQDDNADGVVDSRWTESNTYNLAWGHKKL